MTAFIGSADFTGAGSLATAATAPVQLARATSQYDSAGVTSNSVNLTVPAAVQQDDLGFILITWPPIITGRSVLPVTISAIGWDTVVDNSNSSFAPFIVLKHAYVSGDGDVELDFSQSIQPTVVASWYPGISDTDVIGAVNGRNGASSPIITATSVPVNGGSGGMLVAFLAERSSTTGTIPTSISNAVQRVFLEGSGSSTASALIADSYAAAPGNYGDVVTTYNTPSNNGSGVLISLLPTNTVPAGRPMFSGTGGLQVTGIARLGTPQFSSSGGLTVSGAVLGRVNSGGSGGLRVNGRPTISTTAHLGAGGQLKTTPTGKPALGGNGGLVVTGKPRIQAAAAALGGQGRFQPVGIGTGAGLTALGSAGSLSIQHPLVSARGVSQLTGRGGLLVVGHPIIPSSIALGGRGTTGARTTPRTGGHAGMASNGNLEAVANRLTASGILTLGAASRLVMDGLADQTLSDIITLTGQGRLQVVGTLGQQAPAFYTAQPYYIRKQQSWVVEQERQRHIQALYAMGEPVLFVLMWKVEDYEAGLVTRCPRCAPSTGTIEAQIADVYAQPETTRCPFCYGTTFYGGIRAKIKRPALITDADEDERKGVRGVTHAEQIMVQTTDDFRIRTGDYLFRQDNSRWQLGHPSRIMIRTGYGHPSQAEDSIGYNPVPAAREDRSSVAYDIPPNREELLVILQSPDYLPA